MFSIVDHIEYLLAEHDCVIVPGWGAFIAQYTSSSVDDAGFRITRPERRYSFNGSIDYNDGLLANSVMRRDRCKYLEANDRIAEAVASLKQQVSLDGELAIGRLGIFKPSEDNALVFEPFDTKISAGEFYGLRSFCMKPLTVLNKESNIKEHGAKTAHWYIPISKNYMKIAASVIILLVMTFVLTTPIVNNKASQDYASLNSFSIKEGSPGFEVQNGELAIMMPREKPVDNEDKILVEKEPKDIKQEERKNTVLGSNDENGRYCLVVASGANRTEATKFISRQKQNHNFRLLKKGSKYRVYIATGDSYRELENARIDVKSQYSDAWICKR